MKSALSFLFLLTTFSLSLAQTSAAIEQDVVYTNTQEFVDWANFENELVEEPTAWTFQVNTDIQSLYIDFEQLGGKFTRVEFLDKDGKLLFSDATLFDLPVNTIYELNLEKFGRGVFFVELTTITDEIIREEITVN